MLTDPPPGSPTLRNIDSTSPLVLYEGDPLEMTCDIVGGSPLATLTWDCPGLDSQTGSDSIQRWSTVSGTVRRSLNNQACACTAQHYAWLPPESQTRIVHTPFITVYCKLQGTTQIFKCKFRSASLKPIVSVFSSVKMFHQLDITQIILMEYYQNKRYNSFLGKPFFLKLNS